MIEYLNLAEHSITTISWRGALRTDSKFLNSLNWLEAFHRKKSMIICSIKYLKSQAQTLKIWIKKIKNCFPGNKVQKWSQFKKKL